MLVPVAQHQTRFVVPGLTVDPRGVCAGRVGALLLPSLDRVVAAVAVLTADVAADEIYAALEVNRVRSTLGAIEHLLRFPVGDLQVLDRIAAVAALEGGELLTGEAVHFVRYRDRHSPLGYDVDRLAEKTGDLMLYGRVAEGPYRIEETVPLKSLLLRLAPAPVRTSEHDLDRLLVRAVPGLRSEIEGYLWRNRVDGEVARAVLDGGEEIFLYGLQRVPARVAALLGATPGFTVLVPEGERAAVERGFAHPFDLAACAAALEDDALYLFRGGRPGAEILRGQLTFLPLRRAVRPQVAEVPLPATPAEPGPRSSLPLRLATDPDGAGRAEALLVPARQLPALRHLLYLLTPAALARYRAATLDRGVLLVADETVEEVPLGVPLRRYGDVIYLPLGQMFLPRLPPELVEDALGAEPGWRYVFLHPGEPPFSVAEGDLEPLSRAFLARLEARPAEVVGGEPAPGGARITFESAGGFPLWRRRFRPPEEPR